MTWRMMKIKEKKIFEIEERKPVDWSSSDLVKIRIVGKRTAPTINVIKIPNIVHKNLLPVVGWILKWYFISFHWQINRRLRFSNWKSNCSMCFHSFYSFYPNDRWKNVSLFLTNICHYQMLIQWDNNIYSLIFQSDPNHELVFPWNCSYLFTGGKSFFVQDKNNRCFPFLLLIDLSSSIIISLFCSLVFSKSRRFSP